MNYVISASIALACDSQLIEYQHQAHTLAQDLNLPLVTLPSPNYCYLLVLTDQRLELRCPAENWQAIAVDFLSPKTRYRQHKGGGKNQLIAKAVGMKKNYFPTILDATAGLGQDGFILASLGCSVTLVERSEILSVLLADGLQRLFAASPTIPISLITADAIDFFSKLSEQSHPDVIYLDPMFPHQGKHAEVKKEMRLLRAIVGDDADAEVLLKQALLCAKKRVVVKRPRLAPPLGQQPADLVLTGRSGRFDIYFRKSPTPC